MTKTKQPIVWTSVTMKPPSNPGAMMQAVWEYLLKVKDTPVECTAVPVQMEVEVLETVQS